MRSPSRISRTREQGSIWLTEISRGNGPTLFLAERNRTLRFKILIVLYLLFVCAYVVYVYAIDYLALSLTIIAILVPIIISWPTLWDLPLKSARETYARTNIMTIPMAYDYGNEHILVTVINVGDTAVIGEIIVAVGFVERTTWKGRLKFSIYGYSPLEWGYRQLETGDVLRLSEADIHGAVKQAIQRMGNENSQDAKATDADILILVMRPEGIEMKTGKFPIENLLSASSLGITFTTAEATVVTDKSLWVQEIRIDLKTPSGKIVDGQPYPMTIEMRAPPFEPTTRELLAQIRRELHELAKKK